jgi:ribosome modulation factor
MPKRDQQEARVADEYEAGPAENSQQDCTTPADAVEIADATANDQRQECYSGPEVAVNCQIEWRKSGGQAVTDTGKSGRPEEGCPYSADNADGR